MYLKTLTLRGFKSFASATRFEFEPGVTCVVGPNGSGKSNVVDALAWVMGEQGAKTLRGGKMEDVIFAGTTGRAALGRAEVSLTIDNSDGALPIEYAEVTITRTLFRNGGSEYAINGAPARLLDIQELLSDSGLGREMHVIVGQGQLDHILRATPLERRGFIEEASGVLKHRKRKEKALRKLDNMQGNLHRLNDLITELRRQLGPLGRQAQAARKAAVIAAQVRDSGLRLLADDLNTQFNARDDLLKALETAKNSAAEQSQRVDLLRARLSSVEKAEAQLSPQAQRASEVLMGLTSQRERVRSIANIALERQRHLGAPQQRSGQQGVATLKEQISKAVKALEECGIEVNAVRARLEVAEKERHATNQQHALLTHRKEQEQQRKAAHRERVSKVGADVASQRTRVEVTEQSIARIAQDIEDTRKRLIEIERQSLSIGTGTGTGPGTDSAPSLDVAALHELEAALALRVDEVAREQRTVRESHLESERQRVTHQALATAHASALEKALGSARALVEADPGLHPLAQHLNIDSKHEQAIAAALTNLRHAVVALSYEQALGSARYAREVGLAAAVIAYPAQSSQILTRPTDLPDGTLWASDLVSVPQHNLALAQLLSTVVVASADVAREIVSAHPQLTVVTETGVVITNEWIVSQPQEDQVFALQRNAEQEQLRADALATEADGYAERLRQLDADAAALQVELKECRVTIRTVQEKARQFEAANARTLALKDAAQRELDRLEKQRLDSVARLGDQTLALTKLVGEYDSLLAQSPESGTQDGTQDHGGTAQAAVQVEVALSDIAEALERVREVETLARLDLRSAQEKHRNLDNRVAGLERALRQEQAAEAAAEQAAQLRAQQFARAQWAYNRANALTALIDTSIARAQLARDQAMEQRDRYAKELGQTRADVDSSEQRLRELTQQVHHKELELSGVVGVLAQFENRSVEEFGLSATEAVEQFGPHQEVPLYALPQSKVAVDEELPEPDLSGARAFDRDYLEKTYERATKALGSLGKVNPLALEEYAALEERHKFLSDQLADLKKSRGDLLHLVEDIDARVQEVFASAFKDTAEQFSRVFPRLFPGGEGKMFLTDPADMLNTGIEIEARPAGKKVKRLSLLSGGERSLTAIAMLVSIFKARPSPFYVMDEVEAALDDVNLGRLLGVFKELQEDSQLIVITHQKRTMEIADALYGVTMQGDGISAVLSQRMDRDYVTIAQSLDS